MLIDVTAAKMARQGTRASFYIDHNLLSALNDPVHNQDWDKVSLLRKHVAFLTFLAHVALRKTGFDIVVCVYVGSHFKAHILFFDPVDSNPQITLLNQGYSCRERTIDGLNKPGGLDDELDGVFWFFRAFNVLNHCRCGIILPAASVRTETCECPPRTLEAFKKWQREAFGTYTVFTERKLTVHTRLLWEPSELRIHIIDQNHCSGELQNVNDCAAYVIYGLRLLYSSQQRPTSERIPFLDHNLTTAAVRFSRSTLISNAMAGVPRDSCWSCQVRLAKMFNCAQGCMFFLCELCSWEQTSIDSGAPTPRQLTTQTFLRTIRPHTHVVSSTTSACCRLCTAAVDNSCAAEGLCKYCRLTTVEKQRTCCFCWSPMVPSRTALPGAPAAASEAPTSPSSAAASPGGFTCGFNVVGAEKYVHSVQQLSQDQVE